MKNENKETEIEEVKSIKAKKTTNKKEASTVINITNNNITTNQIVIINNYGKRELWVI